MGLVISFLTHVEALLSVRLDAFLFSRLCCPSFHASRTASAVAAAPSSSVAIGGGEDEYRQQRYYGAGGGGGIEAGSAVVRAAGSASTVSSSSSKRKKTAMNFVGSALRLKPAKVRFCRRYVGVKTGKT